MKNYLANENGNWDTGSACVRYHLEQCIEMGRRYSQSANEAEHCEALRLLGTALHTLEDFSAHSNYIELALQELGSATFFAMLVNEPESKSMDALLHRWSLEPLAAWTSCIPCSVRRQIISPKRK